MDALAVDMGNVIIDHLSFGTTVKFVEEGNYSQIPAVKDALACLRELNTNRFKDHVYIVYNATGVADFKIECWLSDNNFYEITGIKKNKIIRSKEGRNKSAFCIDNNINHFVDDRLEVLFNLIDYVPHLYLLRGQKNEMDQYKQALPKVAQVKSWKNLLKLLNERR